LKILLFGANGQLGTALQAPLARIGTVVPVARQGAVLTADFADTEQLGAIVRAQQPRLIVNAAAWTAVDAAESHRDAAFAVNATAVAALAREARACGAWLVHYGTDYVFDGSGTRAWREDDEPRPINVYGASKRAGEVALTQSGCLHLLLRVSWVWSPPNHGFVSRVRARMLAGEVLEVVNDQIGAPTNAHLIAGVTTRLLPLAMARPAMGGTYHLAATGETSLYGVAEHIARVLRAQGHAVPPVQAVPSAQRRTAAARPLNSRLDTSRLQAAFGVALPAWDADLDEALSRWPVR
jgi:dTDP-4-dehydrorhamnose reductase